MPLPKLDKPLFEENIPSLDRKIKMRPFAVREEKILLMAQQSAAEKGIILAIKQVLNNCIAEEGFDINTLATFDLEYLFLKLRARSVSNIISVSYRDNEDDKVYDFTIDLDEVDMLKKSETSNVIMITDNIGIKMKYPSVTIIDGTPSNINATELVEYLVSKCIDVVFEGDNVYPASDFSDKEMSEWLDQLDVESFNKIREFFSSLPQMYYKIEYKNSLDHDRVIELTTLSDFFTWR